MAQVESRGGWVDARWPTRVPTSYLISPQLCPGPPLLLASTASHSEPGESGGTGMGHGAETGPHSRQVSLQGPRRGVR